MVDNQGQLVLSSVRTVRLSQGVSKLQAIGTQTTSQRAHLRPNTERHLSVTVGGYYCWTHTRTHTHTRTLTHTRALSPCLAVSIYYRKFTEKLACVWTNESGSVCEFVLPCIFLHAV